MKTFNKLLLIISTIFVFHVCDNRDAINQSEKSDQVHQLILSENSGNYEISLSDQVQSKTIKAIAKSAGGTALEKIKIDYKIIEGPGSLNKETEISDSTVTLSINLNDFQQDNNTPYIVKIEGTVKNNPEKKDTIIFTEESISSLNLREVNSDYVIALTSLNQEKTIEATAVDGSGGLLNNINIEYYIHKGSEFAYLSESDAITDSTVTLTINVEENSINEDDPITVIVKGYIKENPTIEDSLVFMEQSISELQLTEVSGDYNVIYNFSDQYKTLQAKPIDENSSFVSGIDIGYRVLNNGPGILAVDYAPSDTTVQLTINLADANLTGMEDHIVAVEAFVESKPSISDIVYFSFSDFGEGSSGGGLSLFIDNDTIPYINEFNQTIEHATVSAALLDSIGTPVNGEWIEFESIIDSANTWIPFGTMTPEMALTNELGVAQSVFQSATKTGFGRIVAKTLGGESDTTIIYVSPSEAITLEILPPSPDNEISVMGGGNLESAQITAEVRDGNGNLVNTDYLIRFTIPCDYPLDTGGACPLGDGDFTNDIKINGIIVNTPQEPSDIVTTVNGQASITLNSGNVPGSVKLRAELFNIDDDLETATPIAVAEETPLTIVTGPPAFGTIGYAFLDADTIGGGLYEMPISVMLWDIWTNPVSDCTNVYFSMHLETAEAGVIIGEAKTGNENPDTGNSYPGVAWTTIQYASSQVFLSPVITAQTNGAGQSLFEISSGDNIVSYINPLEGGSLAIQPVSPTVTDYCQTDNEDFIVTVRGTLRDPYGVPVNGGQIQMTIHDAIAYEYVADANQPGQGGALPSQTQISDEDGLVTWIIRFTHDNCYNTDTEDPHAFDCAAPTLIASLYDPNGATSEEISITLIKSCDPTQN